MNGGLPSSPYVIRSETYREHRQSGELLQRAEDKVRKLLSDATAQAALIREQAHRDGLSEGLARGARLSEAMAEKLATFWQERQEELLELVLAAAHRILHELPHEELLYRLARECLAAHAREVGLTIRVAPSASDALQARLGDEEYRVIVIADSTLADGDGVLVHPTGRTEFGLLAQFRSMLQSRELHI